MVTDLNKFYPGKYMAPGLFHVVEQLVRIWGLALGPGLS
jgi:hypothetical protein